MTSYLQRKPEAEAVFFTYYVKVLLLLLILLFMTARRQNKAYCIYIQEATPCFASSDSMRVCQLSVHCYCMGPS